MTFLEVKAYIFGSFALFKLRTRVQVINDIVGGCTKKEVKMRRNGRFYSKSCFSACSSAIKALGSPSDEAF
jgi:hypothetical protein